PRHACTASRIEGSVRRDGRNSSALIPVRSTAITIQHTTMFVPLHVKSEHSLGHGTSSVDALVRHAVGFGFPALALTDVENLHGEVKFNHAARAHGVRAITGVERR